MRGLVRSAVLVAAIVLTLAAAFTAPSPRAVPAAPLATPSAFARRDIPAGDLTVLEAAAATCPGLPWPVLAAIAKVESDFGRSTLPGVHWGANGAGAMGPFQFEPGTWREYGSGDVYDFADAAFAAARLLCANGAGNPARLAQAIFAYNHAWWYVREVLDWAARYAAAGARAVWQGLSGALQGSVGSIRVLGTRVTPLFPWVPAGGYPDPFPPGQCTYYAAFEHLVTWGGNAADWWTNARAMGAFESRTPTVGAIAVWRAGAGYSLYGHVGIVVGIMGYTFTVQEMNYLGLGIVDQRVDTVADPALNGFIT